MRVAAFIVLASALILPAAVQPARAASAAQPAVDEIFRDFNLFGTWAGNCDQPASPDNPHVEITQSSPGVVLESHDLGPDYAVNRYSVLSAERLSATRVGVKAIFQPGTEDEEKQQLIFAVRGNTRRTLFNQVEGGTVRVRDGIALALHVETPVLKKCG